MSHPRTQIRNAAISLFREIDAFEGRVTGYRLDPHYDLPSLVVSVADADAGGDMVDPELQIKGTEERHTISLAIEVRETMADGMDDRLDALCLAIEQCIEADKRAREPLLAALVHDLQPVATTMEIEGGDTEREVGLALMTYQGNYRINSGSRETII